MSSPLNPAADVVNCQTANAHASTHIGEDMARRHYQRGSLRKEGKWWILRWRETVINKLGNRERPETRARVGLIKDLPTERLARRVPDEIILHVNAPDYRPGKVITVEEFAPIYAKDATIEFKASFKRTVKTLNHSHIVPLL